jgi:hypothetical protein
MLEKIKNFTKKNSADIQAIVFFALLNLILLFPLFFYSGEIFFRDFTFPIFQDSFREYHLPVWNWQRDTSNISSLYRLFARSPFLLLSFILPVSTVLKIYLFFTVFIAQVSFYYFQKKILNINNNFVLIASSLLFSLNSRVIDFLWETSLVWSYSFTPLLITLFTYSLKEKAIFNKYFFFSSLVLLLMFVHPYSFAATFGIALIWFVFISKVKTVGFRIYRLLYLGLMHFLLSLYFLVPFVTSWIYGGPITPETKGFYKYSIDVVNYLSSTSLIDELSLVRDVIKFVDYYPSNIYLMFFWYLSSLSIVLGTVFLSIKYSINKKNVHRNITSVYTPVFLLGLMLSLGSDGLTGFIYRAILDALPADFIWLFRSPLKIQLYIFIPLSIMFSIVVNGFFMRVNISSKLKDISKFAISIIIVFYSIFTITGYFYENRFVPVEIPEEYREIDALFSNIDDAKKVIYYPRYNERETIWGENRLFQPWDQISSNQPTISYWWSDPQVFDYLYNNIYSKRRFEDICDYLGPLGIDYLVFHNDRVLPFRNFDEVSINRLKSLYSNNIIYEKNEWYVFDLKCSEQYIISRKPNIKFQSDLNFESKLFKNFNLTNLEDDSYETEWSLIEKNKIEANYTVDDQTKLVEFGDVQKSLFYLDNDTYIREEKNSIFFNPKNFLYQETDETEIVVNPELTIKTINDVTQVDDVYTIKANTERVIDRVYNIETDEIEVGEGENRLVNIQTSITGTNLQFPHLTYILLNEEGQRVFRKEIPINYTIQASGQDTTYIIDEIINTTPDTNSVILKLKGTVPVNSDSVFEVNELRVSTIDSDDILNNEIELTFNNIEQESDIFAKVLKNSFAKVVNSNNPIDNLEIQTNIAQGLDSYQYVRLGRVNPNNSRISLQASSIFTATDLVLIPTQKTRSFNNYITFDDSCETFGNQNTYRSLQLDNGQVAGYCSNLGSNSELNSLNQSIDNSKRSIFEGNLNVKSFEKINEDTQSSKTSIQMPLLYRAGLYTQDSDEIGRANKVMLTYNPSNISNSISFSYIQDNYFYVGLGLSIITLLSYGAFVYYKEQSKSK